MPTRVVSRQEAKQKDKETKEAYPKYKLSKAFGYGQFISSDRLFEVYDTKLVKQAEKDALAQEERKAQREKDIQDKRELHQRKIKEILKNNFRSSQLLNNKNLKYEINRNDDLFDYRTVKNGTG